MEFIKIPGLTYLPQVSSKNILEKIHWGEDFSSRQLDVISSYFGVYEGKADTTILQEGHTNNFFALICEGSVKVVKMDFAEKEKPLQLLKPGKVFGEMSFFDGGACSASIVVDQEAKFLIMDKKNFALLTEETASLALMITIKLIKDISHRLRHTNGKLIDLI